MHIAQTDEAESKCSVNQKDLNTIEKAIVDNINPCLKAHTAAVRHLTSEVTTRVESLENEIKTLRDAVVDLKDALLLSRQRTFLPTEVMSKFSQSLSEATGDTTAKPSLSDFLTSKGSPRKKGKYVKREEQAKNVSDQDSIPPVHMSDCNVTVQDFWNEYTKGINCQPALRDMEKNYGSKWRRDAPMKKAKAMAWSRRKIIYDLIEFMTDRMSMPEEEAILSVQKVFNDFEKSKNGKVRNKEALRAALNKKLKTLRESI